MNENLTQARALGERYRREAMAGGNAEQLVHRPDTPTYGYHWHDRWRTEPGWIHFAILPVEPNHVGGNDALSVHPESGEVCHLGRIGE